jgi:hypothetical protein
MFSPLRLYLASPYSNSDPDKQRRNYDFVFNFVGELVNSYQPRVIVFSPIVYAHELADRFSLPVGVDFWWPMNQNFIQWCNWFGIYQLPGWDRSEGVRRELDYARSLRGSEVKTIVLFPYDPATL